MNKEWARYNRQIILDEIGEAGQQKLAEASVAIIGVGGLGSPIIQYLSSAGVGSIKLIDADKVSISNLHRQVLFTERDLGRNKVDVAKDWILSHNSSLQVEVINTFVNPENVFEIVDGVDVVVDGSDNFSTKYLLSDATDILSVPLVTGAIFKFTGQVSVYNYEGGATYRCLFPDMPKKGEIPNCEEAGVIGVLPGIIGSIQANEVLKVILGYGDILTGRLFTIDLTSMQSNVFEFERIQKKRTDLEVSYELECEVLVDEIDALEFEKVKEDYLILDVREEFEVALASINGAINIPLNQLPNRLNELPKNRKIATLCHHGIRSAHAKSYLEELGYSKVVNINGGIDAYSLKVDQGIPRY